MWDRTNCIAIAKPALMILSCAFLGCSSPPSTRPAWSDQDVYVFRSVGPFRTNDRRYVVHGFQAFFWQHEGAIPRARYVRIPYSLLEELKKWSIEKGAKELNVNHTGKPYVSRTTFRLGKYEDRQTQYWLSTEMEDFLKKLDELELDEKSTKESMFWLEDVGVKMEIGAAAAVQP